MESEMFMLAVRYGTGETAKMLRQCVADYAEEIAGLNRDNARKVYRDLDDIACDLPLWQGPVMGRAMHRRAMGLANALWTSRRVRPQQEISLFRLANYLAKRDAAQE